MDPVFAIVDDQAYYGIYDDRKILGDFLRPHQRLHGIPRIMESGFTNGVVVFEKISWEYAQQKRLSMKETIGLKKRFITQLIGDEEDFVNMQHSIVYHSRNHEPPVYRDSMEMDMVATYHDDTYNYQGIRNLMEDLGKGDSIQVIPLLMEYLEDDRSIDTPADDHGNTTIGSLAEAALKKIHGRKPELFINYTKPYLHRKSVQAWWEGNKSTYAEEDPLFDE